MFLSSFCSISRREVVKCSTIVRRRPVKLGMNNGASASCALLDASAKADSYSANDP